MGTLLDQQHQSQISGVTPCPVDRVDDTSVVNTSSSETVVWYYNNSGSWGAAATQAAGTVCVGKLTYSGVLNSNGSAIGCKDDTSLSWGAATRVSTLVRVPEEAFSKMLDMTVAEKVSYIATWVDTNGDYAIDHRRGEVWMKSKATVANDAATYKYATPLTGGGSGDKVDLIKIGGVSTIADDGAYTAGTSTGIVAFGFADETATDSVGEGDCGALRMTLDRKLHISSNFKEDAAHADGDYGTQVLAVRNDTLAALCDADGDYTPLQVDASGALYTLDSNSASIKTAVELIDDVVATLGTTTYTEATSKGALIGAVRNDTLAALADTDNEIAPLQVNASGALYTEVSSALPAGDNNIGNVDIVTQPARDNATDTITASLDTNAIMNDTTACTPKFAAINATNNGDNTIVAAVADKKIRVLSYAIVADAAVGVAFEDGAGGSELSGQMAFAANGGISVPFSPVGHFETSSNTLLNLETDAAANVRGHITYIEV